MSELPQGWASAELGEIRLDKLGAVNPLRAPDQTFELYSVPAFPSGQPEIVAGKTIGSSKQTVSPGTVLVCKINPRINRAWVVGNFSEFPKLASTEWIAFPPIDGIEARYLSYFFRQDRFRDFLAANVSGVGGSLMRVRRIAIDSFPIVIPPTREQARISAKLDELLSDLDAGIAALERARANLKRYRAAVLKAAVEGRLTEKWRAAHLDVEPAGKLLERILAERRRKWEEAQLKKFAEKKQAPPKGWKENYSEPVNPEVEALARLPSGWAWVRAEQICGFITKGTTPSASLLTSALGQVPFIKVYNLTNRGVLDFSVDPTFVSAETHTGFLGRSRVYPGDVLMNIVGPPLGKVSIVSEEHPEWNINQAIAIFRPVSGVDKRYLALCLLTDVVLDWAVARGKATAGQTNLTLEICRDLPIPFPPLDEQIAIADEVSRLVSIVEVQHQAIGVASARASRLRQAILKRAFEGKLVPQDPKDEPASELLARIRASRGSGRAVGTSPARRLTRNAGTKGVVGARSGGKRFAK